MSGGDGERILVSKARKTLDRILRGTSDADIRFAELVALLRHLGFQERVRGGHHIFTHDGIPEILNLQPRGNKAKAYQVKQVRAAIVSHRLVEPPDADTTPTQQRQDPDLRLLRPEQPELGGDEHSTREN